MPWNPSDQNDKDPWGRKKKTQGPPDLDALLRQYKGKMVSLLKGKKGTNFDGGVEGEGKGFFVGIIIFLVLVVWALLGIYIVSPSERAVVLRLGKYVET